MSKNRIWNRKSSPHIFMVFKISSKQILAWFDILWTVYHLVIYMQSNKIHSVVLMSEFYSALKLARHISDLIGPSSGAFCTSCIRRLWYVVLLCVLLDTFSWTCRVVRLLPHTKVCEYSLYKTLLMMDR